MQQELKLLNNTTIQEWHEEDMLGVSIQLQYIVTV